MSKSIAQTYTTKTTSTGVEEIQFVTTGTNVTSKVFAIEVLPASADSSNAIYRFSNVCSPFELQEYPEDTPGDNCYFRTNDITMLFDTKQIAELTLQHIREDIQHLVKELNALEAAQSVSVTETFS